MGKKYLKKVAPALVISCFSAYTLYQIGKKAHARAWAVPWVACLGGLLLKVYHDFAPLAGCPLIPVRGFLMFDDADVLRFYDGGGGDPPVSVPDWVADEEIDALVADEMLAGEMAEMASLADAPDAPDVLDVDDGVADEMTARGLAVPDDMPKDNRLRWWEIVAWHDSVAPDWADRWDARPDVRGLAVWHDRDVKDAITGELKKKHLHAMAGDSHGRKWSHAQALRFARDVFGLRPGADDRLVRPIKSPAAYGLYLTHANAPKKFQYPRSSVMAFGGVDLDMVVGVVDNEKDVLSAIYDWVDDFADAYGVLPAYAGVIRYANACRPSWARILAGRGGRAVRSYLRSVEYDSGVDGRGAGTLALVREIIRAEKSGHAKLLGERNMLSDDGSDRNEIDAG